MNKTMHIKSNKKGFTLVELLVAMAISGIVAGAIFTAFLSQQKSYLVQEQVAEMQQNIRAAMDIMVREIRMAGYDPTGFSGATILGANSSNINITMDIDGDGNCSSTETITYSLYDAYGDSDNDIGRQVGSSSSTKRAVAENIEEIEFYYTLADGTNATVTTNPSEIRSVQIAILARAGHEDSKFCNSKNYTKPSGDHWGPYDDGFRRRLLSTTVKCRNMGL